MSGATKPISVTIGGQAMSLAAAMRVLDTSRVAINYRVRTKGETIQQAIDHFFAAKVRHHRTPGIHIQSEKAST